MFKIIPIQEKNEQERMCALCGMEYEPDYLAYGAYEEGRPLACAQFKIQNNCALIKSIAQVKGVSDTEVLIFTGRAVFNFADRQGCSLVKCEPGAGSEKDLLTVGFKKDGDGVYFADLTKIFGGCGKDK